jgi:hypothetical protein
MIKGVSDLLDFLKQDEYLSAEHAHSRYMFRGHGDKEWALVPAVYRSNFKFEKKPEQDCEDARLRLEQHLFQEFRVMSAGLRSGRETDCDLYALQQHHGMPTRLLDWSNNALAALYFAVSDRSQDCKDGTFFTLDAYRLAWCQGTSEDKVKGVATFARPYLRDAVSVISEWKNKACFGEWIVALRPDHNHTRMALQRSCFTFHVPLPQEFDLSKLSCVKAIDIKADCKHKIRRELAALGIDDFSIYGDLDHLARRLKAAYLT